MLLAMPLAALLVLVAFGALYVRRRRARGARPSARTLVWLAAPVAAVAAAVMLRKRKPAEGEGDAS